jgi:Leucine-rich repeat (LRR) protein
MSINLMTDNNLNRMVNLLAGEHPSSALDMLEKCGLNKLQKGMISRILRRAIADPISHSMAEIAGMKKQIHAVLHSKDNPDLGNLAVLSEDMVCKILSHSKPLDLNENFSTCQAFECLYRDSLTIHLHLESELADKKELTIEEIEAYRTQFRKKYGEELSYSKIFSYCPHLANLEFSHSSVNDATLAVILEAVKKHCQLQMLYLNGCKKLTKQLDLSGLSQLTMLWIDNCRNLVGLAHLNELSQLKTLFLEQCPVLGGHVDFKEMSQLTTLWIENCPIVVGLAHINELIDLKTLILAGCTGLTGELDLRGLTQLQKLSLRGSNALTGLRNLDKLIHLQELDLTECTWVTAQQLPLKKLTKLKILYLSDCTGLIGPLDLKGLTQLQFLHVHYTHITELTHLNELIQLQGLAISGCMELLGVLDLTKLSQLKWVNLNDGAGLTEIIIGELSSPIIWNSPEHINVRHQ